MDPTAAPLDGVHMSRRNTLIEISGADGTGKTTLSRMVVERLGAKGVPAVYVSETNMPEFFQGLRSLIADSKLGPRTKFLMFRAASAELTQRYWDFPGIVVRDRGWLDGMVYGTSLGAGRLSFQLGFGVESLARYHHWWPNSTVVLHASIETCRSRQSVRPEGVADLGFDGEDFQRDVHASFHSITGQDRPELPPQVNGKIWGLRTEEHSVEDCIEVVSSCALRCHGMG